MQERAVSSYSNTMFPFFELASAGLRKSMQVDKIVDFKQLFEIISAVGMKTDGLETKEEMKEKLCEHIEESSKRQQDAKVSTDLEGDDTCQYCLSQDGVFFCN